MTIFIWNLYEKSFTPYHAQLAPKRFVHRHKIDRQVSRVSRTFQDSKVKSMMRFLRKYILSNTRYFHFSVLLCKEFILLNFYIFNSSNEILLYLQSN